MSDCVQVSGSDRCTYQLQYHLGGKLYTHKILSDSSRQNRVKYPIIWLSSGDEGLNMGNLESSGGLGA